MDRESHEPGRRGAHRIRPIQVMGRRGLSWRQRAHSSCRYHDLSRSAEALQALWAAYHRRVRNPSAPRLQLPEKRRGTIIRRLSGRAVERRPRGIHGPRQDRCALQGQPELQVPDEHSAGASPIRHHHGARRQQARSTSCARPTSCCCRRNVRRQTIRRISSGIRRGLAANGNTAGQAGSRRRYRQEAHRQTSRATRASKRKQACPGT